MKSLLIMVLLCGMAAAQTDNRNVESQKQPPTEQPQQKYITYSVIEKAQANIVAKSAKKRVAHVEKLLREGLKLQARIDAIQAELAKPEYRGVAEVIKASPEK